jgi:hypothetical protein
VLEKLTEERAHSSSIHICDKYVLSSSYWYCFVLRNIRSGKWDVQMLDETLQVERGRIVSVLHNELKNNGIEIHFGMKYV